MRTTRFAMLAVVAVVVVASLAGPARANLIYWNNVGTEWASTSDWTGGAIPGTADVAVFDTRTKQPNIGAADASVLSLWFKTSGWSITRTSPRTLTLGAGYDYSGEGGPAGVYSIYSAATSSTNSISGVPITLGATQSWYVASGGELTVSGGITGGAGIGLTKAGGGKLTLYSANSIAGGFTLNGGTALVYGAVNPFGGGNIHLQSGTLELQNGGNVGLGSGDTYIDGDVTIKGANAAHNWWWAGGKTVLTGSRTLTINNFSSSYAMQLGAIKDGTSSGASLTLAWGGNGSGAIQISGADASLTGTVTVSSGMYIKSISTATNPLGTGALILGSVTLYHSNITGGVGTYGNSSIRLDGDLALTTAGNPGNLNLGTSSTPITLTGTRTITATSVVSYGYPVLAGAIGDGGNGYGLTKAGTGTLKLSNTNTYTGLTTLSAGMLELAAANAVVGSLDLNAGTLKLSHASAMATSGVLNVYGGTITLGTSSTIKQQHWYNSFSIGWTNNGDGLSGPVTLHNDITLTGTGAIDNLYLRGVISDDSPSTPRKLTLAGPMSRRITAKNTFTGGLLINLTYDSARYLFLEGVAGDATGDPLGMGPVEFRQGKLAGGQNGDGSSRANITITGNNAYITTSERALTLSGTITVAPDITAKIGAGLGLVYLTGEVTGNGNVLINGANGIRAYLGGSANNTWTGTTTIGSGYLTLGKTAGVNAVPGNVTIGDGSGTDVLEVQVNNQIPDTAVLTFMAGGQMRIGDPTTGKSETIGGLSSTATTAAVMGSSWGVGASTLGIATPEGQSYNFAGVIQNSGTGTNGSITLTKSGLGTQTLSGANTYTGTTTINGGTLRINGSLNTQTSAVTVNNTGILGGTGTISRPVTVNAGGHVAAGASVGTLTVASLSMASGSIFDFEFNATPANDQTLVTGALTLPVSGNDVLFNLFAENTETAWSTPGTYNLVRYGSLTNAFNADYLAVNNPVGGKLYTFQTANVGGNNWLQLIVANSATREVKATAVADNTNVVSAFGAPVTMEVTALDNTLHDWGTAVSSYSPARGAGPGNPVAIGYEGRATFLAGSSTTDPQMSWRSRVQGEVDIDGVPLASDVVLIENLATSGYYVLQLRYDETAPVIAGNEEVLAAANRIFPVVLSAGDWVPAGTGSNLGDYSSQTTVGEWGVDIDSNTVWVVLGGTGGTFAVVPEPATLGFLALGGLSMAVAAIRRRRKA